MDNFYLIIIIVLFALAISDLIVGVSNDAVNFLNSAIGSKAASFRVILIVAALGILAGTTFSSGMMEVARKSIFHPEHFYFSEIMIIFLAVMMTDIIILDMFNTFGLPTSTTVSIVFELLGAAVAISVVKITGSDGSFQDIANYINSAKALAIISGILLSIILAFLFGAIIQYITRIIFSFNYEKTIKYFGAIWGGIAIAAITYFILIKGAKGSSFISEETLAWIKSNTFTIIIISFAGWTIILQLLMWLIKVNILKLIVLIGTFALAMAFAGNDLVNFIGVPLAGFESFKAFLADPTTNASSFTMDVLKGPVRTPTYLLLTAGLIMVITLWLSRKARSVTKTTIDLSRQAEGQERFESIMFARTIVRRSISLGKIIKFLIPEIALRKINSRFDESKDKENKTEVPAFDLLRASVNLVVASMLIAFGTSLKLPLSTTYVTFMVAMGTSLADKAWGRESAVYRITGVITVVGGWFFTALSAFTVAFFIAFIINYGGIIAITLLIGLTIVFIVKTHVFHKKKETEKKKVKDIEIDTEVLYSKNVLDSCIKNVTSTLSSVSNLYYLTIKGIIKEDRQQLKKVNEKVKKLNLQTKELKNNIHKTILLLQEDFVDTGHYYVQVLDYLRETAHCLTFISQPLFKHVDNNHAPLLPTQTEDLTKINEEIFQFFNFILEVIKNKKFEDLKEIRIKQQSLLKKIKKLNKKQLKMIKRKEAGTRNSLLYLGMLNETKNLLLYTVNLLKAQRDFVVYTKNKS